jgi:predicted pyridoxine 5'-phosphate oxidase superfamily flavin-nucleotide-binding protein
MNEKVIALLKKQPWTLGTYDKEPNAVPVAFKDVTPDGRLTVGDVFLDTTLKNIRGNGKIAVSVFDPATMEGYQIKGRAEYLAAGPVVEGFRKTVSALFKGALTAKGALVITPERVIVTTPGPDNKKEL